MPKKTSVDSVPVQELKTPAIVSVRRFLKSVLIVLLVFVCILVGILVHHLHKPVQDTSPIPLMTSLPASRPTTKPTEVSHRLLRHNRVQKSDTAPDMPIDLPITPDHSEATQIPTVSEPKEISPSESPLTDSVFSLSEAILLRDHLAMGEPCLTDLKQIMHARMPGSVNRTDLIEQLMPICTAHSAFSELQDLFLQNKKEALITYYRLNNPRWLAYLKALGSAIVDIRRIHPLKKRPKDLIFQAQEAMVQKRIAQAVASVQQLPPAIQADFREFSGLAASYLVAQRAAEQLVLSFSEGEE